MEARRPSVHYRAMHPALTTTLAMLAFAGNSLLCRLALRDTDIGPGTFTALRIAAGALVLWAILRLRDGPVRIAGSWGSAGALYAYAGLFAYAYVALSAGTGALLLFAAVQATMFVTGLVRGERPSPLQRVGYAVALIGLVALLMPGLAAPPPLAAASMVLAGIAWGVYSLRGRAGGDPTAETAGNFVRAVPVALAVGMLELGAPSAWSTATFDRAGVGYALASGALTSGLGYAIWYTALRGLGTTVAATVQLSVPAIAAAGGVMLLGEPLTQRLAWSSAAVLGGIAMVVLSGARKAR
jgi:drug/metabolite transporter (DMT)-like permease